jgi:hypothetical protein
VDGNLHTGARMDVAGLAAESLPRWPSPRTVGPFSWRVGMWSDSESLLKMASGIARIIAISDHQASWRDRCRRYPPERAAFCRIRS